MLGRLPPRRSIIALAAALALAIPGVLPARTPAGQEVEESEAADRGAGRAAARAETLGLGGETPVRRILRDGPTAAQLRAAGGSVRPESLIHPLPGARLARGHGSGTNGYHQALDLMGEEGTPILAAESGLVLYTDDGFSGYGKLVVLLHPGGWVTYYSHCSGFTVRPGQTVRRGQRIARVGNTGISRGPHLHFELRIDGEKVDPYPFIRPAPELPRSGPLPHRARRVRRGETLAEIAADVGVSADELRAANHLAPDAALRPGWQLLVPVRIASPDEVDAADYQEPPCPDHGTYAVVEGDTLGEIAARFDLPLDDLARWNDLEDPSRIRVGMVLVLGGEDQAPTDETTPGTDGVARTASEGEGTTTPEEQGALEEAEGEGATAAVRSSDRPDEERTDIHQVAEGETLRSIARALGLRVRDLVEANQLRDPDRLRVGQRLRIPDIGGGPAEDRVAPGGEVPPESLAVDYTIRAGDSLWSIARRHGTSVRTIRTLNPSLAETDRLVPGRRIRVPRER